MSRFWRPVIRPGPLRIGILVVNLGSPDAPDPRAVRRYLRQFLTDPRIIEAPRVPWWLLLNLVILPTRSHRSAARYAKIWTREGSPLIATTRRLAVALRNELEDRTGLTMPVTVGMRYGHPSIAEGLRTLAETGCRRMLVLPLFPQRSATTVGSIMDAIGRELQRWRDVPLMRTVTGYASDAGYIAALAESVREHWHKRGRAQRLLLSFHGIPQRYARSGDPYPAECTTTAKMLTSALELDDESWAMSYQSRFGHGRWLEPSTGLILQQWARQGLQSADVLTPGFATDCLETLEEIAIEDRDLFTNAGGSEYRVIPALNDRPAHIRALAGMAVRNLADWI